MKTKMLKRSTVEGYQEGDRIKGKNLEICAFRNQTGVITKVENPETVEILWDKGTKSFVDSQWLIPQRVVIRVS